MSEESQAPDAGAEGAHAPADPTALSLALTGASRERADAFLDDQRRMLHLQMEEMAERNPFELSHLHWQRFTDRMKGALQIMTLLVGAALVIALATAIWKAAHADGLVIEAFAVPPQMAANGITGEVVAGDLTNKVIAIHNVADENSFGRSKDIQHESGEDIKVEIPETGISVTQGWRILRSWLGHERHLHGSLRALGDGQIALTLDGEDSVTFRGPATDLDRLEQQAAEHAFASVDAGNYVVYLMIKGRKAEAQTAVALDAQAADVNRADFYALWSAITREVGDIPLAIARARLAQAMDPKIGTPYFEAMVMVDVLGHDEEALAQARKLGSVKEADQPLYEQGRGFRGMLDSAASTGERNGGEFADALGRPCDTCSAAELAIRHALFAGLTHDPAQARLLIEEARAYGNVDAVAWHLAQFQADAAGGKWHAAAADARAYGDAFASSAFHTQRLSNPTHAQPLLAIALAQIGDFAGAHAAIDVTPPDCYVCARARGTIRSLEHRWNDAAFWYAQAVRQGPSLPFAYADWGQMLLQKGDPDDAIAQFTLANTKSPHFADALEGWGEALMAKSQSHLAVTKFAAAEKFAPNWGRLQLKWAEALTYAGKPAEAAKHFARADALDLTPTEKSERAQFPHP